MNMVSITRNSTYAPARLLIERIEGPWQLLANNSPILQGTGSGAFSLSLPPDQWLYFCLQYDHGNIFFAEKKLPMLGAYNFRDMGGFVTQQGKSVVWGKLFRADDMMDLTSHDLAYLASIPITSIVDFRTREEAGWAPDSKPASLKHHFHYHVVPGGMSAQSLEFNSGMEADDFMIQVYRTLVLDDKIREIYSKFFQRIIEHDKLPLLFHCSAGKDRTGWAAALFLYALGMDEAIIMADYMLSAQYIQGKYPPDNARFTVKPQYLLAAIAQARQSYGSMEAYITQGLQVDIAKLKTLYLR